MPELLSEVAPLVAEHGLWGVRASGVVARAWDLPRPGIEPTPTALVGGFSTSGPPGKSPLLVLITPGWLLVTN